MRTHRDLEAWKLGIDLADLVYQVTRSFPSDERFGLTAQIRRASVSIPANIAEGAGRQTEKEFCRFLYISRGSLAELETLILIASRVGILEPDQHERLVAARDELGKTLQGLLNSIRSHMS